LACCSSGRAGRNRNAAEAQAFTTRFRGATAHTAGANSAALAGATAANATSTAEAAASAESSAAEAPASARATGAASATCSTTSAARSLRRADELDQLARVVHQGLKLFAFHAQRARSDGSGSGQIGC
jgi:hypothetical protein